MKPLPLRASLLLALSLALPAAAGAASAPGVAPAPATPVPAPVPADGGGDAAASGARLAADGNERGAGPCAACHGAAGQGQPDAGIPRLAGLPRAYLEKQLQDFDSGARRSEVMTPIAKALQPEERSALAAHFAAMAGPATAARAAAAPRKPAAVRGERLVSVGDNRLQVQACANCHGPGARGMAGTAVPWLAGQQPRYVASALDTWRNGTRNNDPSQQMPGIARRLRPEDVEALLAWLATMAPAPAASPAGD